MLPVPGDSELGLYLKGSCMPTRKLGDTNFEIEPLVFGGNVLGWTADEPTSFSLLDAFVAAGFNMIDTADVYSIWAPNNKGGESETIIGKWLKRRGRRDDVIIATKVGWEFSPLQTGLSKSYIQRAVESSLTRLQTDYIDLYQSHIDDPKTPVEETLEAYAQLIRQGKVRAIGASNFTASRLREALEASERHNYPRYQTLQPLYNLIDRAQFETELEPLCLQQRLGVITYFSLASGFLTGKYRSENDLQERARSGEVKKYVTVRNLGILQLLDQVAALHNATQAQIAIAWLLARLSVTAPIASATNIEQLSELIAGTRIDLDRESLDRLNEASDNSSSN
jgi:aryl-alcohol dehydrogenase-like predicted oxidoreductase